MKLSVFTGILLASLLTVCSGKIWEINIPTTLQECYDRVRHADINTFVGSTYSWFCESAIKRNQMDGPQTFDAQKMSYYQHLYDRSVEFVPVMSRSGGRQQFRHRGKRQAGQNRCLRREYRMLTDAQRRNFHNAVNALKQDTTVEPNKFDAISLLHTGMAAFTAHGGAGFPGWHRIYILMFETALREVDSSVCLPYWDSSLDAELEDPNLSPVWSNEFFGSAQGAVTEGPYANWMTPEGAQLMRNVGADGDPFTASAVEDVLTRTRHADILTSEDTEPRYDLEFHHAAVHVYVGGTMGQLDTAAFDPIFFLHHAFVDYIWELFRTNLRGMGVDPEVYPEVSDTDSRHHGTAQTGFGNMTQADGYSDFLSQGYEYEAAPICSASFPECGSRYLTCFQDIGRCVPINPITNVDPEPTQPPTFITPRPDEPNTTPFNPETSRPGPTFGPEPTPTRPNPIPVQTSRPIVRPNPPVQIIPNPSNPGQTFPNTSPNVNPLIVEPTFPNTGVCSKVTQNRRYGNAVQNDFCCDKSCDSNQWATIPVKIVSVRPPKFSTYSSYPVRNGRVMTNSDIYSPSAYSQTNRYITKRQANPKTYKRCGGDEIVGQVFLTSKGINYDGFYKEAAIVDNRLAVSVSMGFVNIKKPSRGSLGVSKALLRAHDSCGRVCHAACKDPTTGEFKECSGAVAVSNDAPLMYGNTYDQAVMNIFDFKFNNDCPAFKSDNFFITFYCDYHNHFPYAKHHQGENHVPHKPIVPKPVPVNIPRSSHNCQVSSTCLLDFPCNNMKQCTGFNQAASCLGSCNQYAVCLYGRYFVKNCPTGERYDNGLKRCVPGFCHNNIRGQHLSHSLPHSVNGYQITHGIPRTAQSNRLTHSIDSNPVFINGNRIVVSPRRPNFTYAHTYQQQRARTINSYKNGRWGHAARATPPSVIRKVSETARPYYSRLMTGYLKNFGKK